MENISYVCVTVNCHFLHFEAIVVSFEVILLAFILFTNGLVTIMEVRCTLFLDR